MINFLTFITFCKGAHTGWQRVCSYFMRSHVNQQKDNCCLLDGNVNILVCVNCMVKEKLYMACAGGRAHKVTKSLCRILGQLFLYFIITLLYQNRNVNTKIKILVKIKNLN